MGVVRHQEGIGASHTRVDVIHHGKDTRPLQVQVGIYVYDGVTAYFHQIVRRLQMELLDAGCIGGCVVLGEVTDIGTQLNGQHLLGEFSQYVEVMVERELGQWKYCFIARLLPGHLIVQVGRHRGGSLVSVWRTALVCCLRSVRAGRFG